MLEIKLTKIHKTVELSPNFSFKNTNLVVAIMLWTRFEVGLIQIKCYSIVVRYSFQEVHGG
jgi:hypothetical protein